jgi:hypothetical protein
VPSCLLVVGGGGVDLLARLQVAVGNCMRSFPSSCNGRPVMALLRLERDRRRPSREIRRYERAPRFEQ